MARWLSSIDPPQFVPVKRSDYSSTLYVSLLLSLFISFIYLLLKGQTSSTSIENLISS